MTIGFERARYTAQPLGEPDFEIMNGQWRDLRKALRNFKENQ
jgi:hypothetical protein